MKKIHILSALAVLSLATIPSVFAMLNENDYSMGTVVSYIGTGTEEYTLTVPAKLNPGKSGSVTLSGQWPYTKTIHVTADDTVQLVNDLNSNNIKELNVDFAGIKLQGDNTQPVSATKTVQVEAITNVLFGKWSGTFYYNIDSTVKAQIPVTSVDKDGNDLNASAYEIPDDEKEFLLGKLDESNLLDIPASEVDAIIEVKSDDFEDFADTTFDVSSIAQPGDKVIILHFDETKQAWEYITDAIVDANGKIQADFTSYSPVAFVVIPKDEENDGEDEEEEDDDEITADDPIYFNRTYSGTVEIEEFGGEVMLLVGAFEDNTGYILLNMTQLGYGYGFRVPVEFGDGKAYVYIDEEPMEFAISEDKKTLTMDFDGYPLETKLEEKQKINYIGRTYSLTMDGDNVTVIIDSANSATVYADGSVQTISGFVVQDNYIYLDGVLMGMFTNNGNMLYIGEDDMFIGLSAEPDYEALTPGLYVTGSNYKVMATTWDELLSSGVIKIEDGVLYTVEANNAPSLGDSSEVASYLAGDLVLPSDGSVIALGNIYEDEENDEKGKYAFYGCTELTGIYIPNSITSIGNMAFASCTSLTRVVIPNSVTTMGIGAFFFCTNLSSVQLPNNLTTIRGGTFMYTGLKHLTIPDSVTTMGTWALGVNNFESLTIGSGLKHVTGVFIDEGTVNYIYVSENNPNFKVVDNVLYSKDGKTLIKYGNGYGSSHFTIPEGVETIADCAFWKCESLYSITIPDSVTTIGVSAFSGCTNLNNVVLPSNLTTLSKNAFRECKALTSITIPEKVTALGDWAFYICENLTTVTFEGNTLTTIGEWTFSDCVKLKNIQIPKSVTTIGQGAFDTCTSLESIVLPQGLSEISDHVFYDCTNLKTVTIPRSVTKIDIYAFEDCDNCTVINYEGSEEDWNKIDISDSYLKYDDYNYVVNYNYNYSN